MARYCRRQPLTKSPVSSNSPRSASPSATGITRSPTIRDLPAARSDSGPSCSRRRSRQSDPQCCVKNLWPPRVRAINVGVKGYAVAHFRRHIFFFHDFVRFRDPLSQGDSLRRLVGARITAASSFRIFRWHSANDRLDVRKLPRRSRPRECSVLTAEGEMLDERNGPGDAVLAIIARPAAEKTLRAQVFPRDAFGLPAGHR